MTGDLLDWTPPVMGSTFQEERDGPRLQAQFLRVRNFMASGDWHTLREIAAATGDPEASCSARLRDMRRAGWTITRGYVANGVWKYLATRT